MHAFVESEICFKKHPPEHQSPFGVLAAAEMFNMCEENKCIDDDSQQVDFSGIVQSIGLQIKAEREDSDTTESGIINISNCSADLPSSSVQMRETSSTYCANSSHLTLFPDNNSTPNSDNGHYSKNPLVLHYYSAQPSNGPAVVLNNTNGLGNSCEIAFVLLNGAEDETKLSTLGSNNIVFPQGSKSNDAFRSVSSALQPERSLELSCTGFDLNGRQTNRFPTECVTSAVPSFQHPVGDENTNRFPTECVTSAVPGSQHPVGDENTNRFPTECVTSAVPGHGSKHPGGDENTNRFPTECVTSAVPSFQHSVGDENTNRFPTECVTSAVPGSQHPVGNENTNRFPTECVTSAVPSFQHASVACPYCAKCFQRSDNLKRHVRVVHTLNKQNKKFSTESLYNNHIRRHENKCPYCSEVFQLRKHLLKHVVLWHKDKDPSSLADESTKKRFTQGSSPGRIRCGQCGDEIDTLRGCLEHRVYNHMVTECWICQKTFSNRKILKRHIKGHTGEKTFPCDHCDRFFATEAERKHHKRFLTMEKSFKCNLCEKGFKLQEGLNNHMATHSTEKPYECTHCLKSFKRKWTYDNHVRTHTGETPYQCKHCDEVFATSRHRRQHEFKEHPDIFTRKKYNCKYCTKSFSTSSSLSTHIRRHTGQGLRCKHCSFVAGAKVNLEIHMNKHTGAKPYKCQYCSKAFSQPSRRVIHERSHTGEKPYACDHCDKAFMDKYSLVRHVRTHTGEKPYKCSYCSKAFAQGCQLQFHERTHTGEKPYECSQCEKKFTRRQELNKHLATHEKRKRQTEAKRKRTKDDSDSDFNSDEMEDAREHDRGERLASLRSAKSTKKH